MRHGGEALVQGDDDVGVLAQVGWTAEVSFSILERHTSERNGIVPPAPGELTTSTSLIKTKLLAASLKLFTCCRVSIAVRPSECYT